MGDVIVKLTTKLLKTTESAVLIEQNIWLPKSQIQIEYLKTKVFIYMPQWLAYKKGLI